MAGEDIKRLLEEGVSLRWARRYAEAEEVFARAVRQAEIAGDHDNLADALGWLAVVRSLASTSPDVLPEVLILQERALEIDVATYGEKHSRVAEGLRNIGRTLATMGRTDDAIQRLIRAAEIFRTSEIPSISAEDTLAQLVSLFTARGAYSSAVDLGRELVSVCERLQDPMRLTMAHFMLGQALVEVGTPTEALEQFEHALSVAAPRIAGGRAQRLVPEVEKWIARARAMTNQNSE